MKPANERPYLRYFFGYGSGVCLWTGNDVALNRFGDYAIDTEALPLSANTRHWLQHLIAWYDTGLDWDDPGDGASPWSDEERARFNLAAQAGFRRLAQELPAEVYELSDESGTQAPSDTPPDYELLARIFAPADNAEHADKQAEALLAKIAAFSPEPINPPEPYWKVPGWYEHILKLSPADETTFDAVVALAGGNWDITRDSEWDAVWNPSPGHIFLLPEVVWVEIMLIQPNPPSPDQEYLPS